MSEASSSPKRPRLDFDDNSSKDEQYDKFKSREIDDIRDLPQSVKSRKRAEMDDDDGKDDDGKSKSLNRETTPREHTLVMRLTNKEQELQECMNQIQEMKQAQTQKTAHLRSMLLDPAINLVFQRMAKEMDEHKEKLKQKQNELSAWKFTPDSQTGMRLMAKCRMLLQENGDLGKMISSGRTARLEGEIALHKALVTEMKKNQKELDEFVGELEEDVEGMQGMIFMLQEQLKEAREQIARLQNENEQLRTLRMPPDPEPGGDVAKATLHDSSSSRWALDHGATPDPHSTSSQLSKGLSDQPGESNPPVIVPPALAALSNSNFRTTDGASDQQRLAQSSDEDSAHCAGFVSKVTPDSGMLTQEEEEEASMDTTDFAESPGLHDPSTPLSQTPPQLSERTTGSSTSTSKTERGVLPESSVAEAESTRTSGSNGNDEISSSAQKSPCDLEGSSTTKSMSSPDSSSGANLKHSAPQGDHSSLTEACDENNPDKENSLTPAISPANGQADVLDSSHEERTDSKVIQVESERTNHTDRASKNGTVNSTASGKERTEEEIEDSKQSLQQSLGVTLGGGKMDEDATDDQAKENLVNGSVNLASQSL